MNTRIRCIMFAFPLMVLFLLVAADPMTLGAQVTAQSGGGPFLAPEILGRPTNHSVTMNVIPTEDLEVYAEFGSTSGAYTARTQTESHLAGTPFEITLDGLQPDTRTYYRIRYRQPGAAEFAAGQERSFWTQRASGSTFTFDIQGDSHPERVNKQFDADPVHAHSANAAADQPDFYMTIGDDFSVDTLKTVNADTVTHSISTSGSGWGWWARRCSWSTAITSRPRWRTWTARRTMWRSGRRPPATPTIPSLPPMRSTPATPSRSSSSGCCAIITPSPGATPCSWSSTPTGIPRRPWITSSALVGRKKNRDLWNNTLGETQYQWFKRTLETSTAKYKFVFAHHVNGTGRGGIELANTYEWGDAAVLPPIVLAGARPSTS